MRLAFIAFVVLISVVACDITKPPVSSSGNAADKLVSHGYRKYTYKQFTSAHKAYLEAYFAYKDAGIKPTPKLYAGFSALIIQRLHNSPGYPIVGRAFIIDDEKELIIDNKIELLKASLQYLLAAQTVGTNEYIVNDNALNEVILCHRLYISGEPVTCDLIDEKLFSYKL